MNQKTEHLAYGDLIIICEGKNRRWTLAIFHGVRKDHHGNVISITFMRLGGIYSDHIRTRNSEYQRVFKITPDNLSSEEMELYQNYISNKTTYVQN